MNSCSQTHLCNQREGWLDLYKEVFIVVSAYFLLLNGILLSALLKASKFF